MTSLARFWRDWLNMDSHVCLLLSRACCSVPSVGGARAWSTRKGFRALRMGGGTTRTRRSHAGKGITSSHPRCLEDFRTRRNQIRQCPAAWRDTRLAAAIASALVFVLASASASPRALHTARARANAERTGARRTRQWLHASATDASAIVRT